MARIITVTSGKGGVGKTNISVNLALQLANLGHRTCLFDADLGLANANIVLGLYPEHTLEDVILNNKTIKDIIIRDYDGIDIIPGSSGIAKMADLEDREIQPLIKSFSELDRYDFILFDTPAGVSRNVISFCRAASEVVLVITPESTSLTDAYGLLKILSQNGFKGPAMVAVNQSKDAKIANMAYSKLKKTVQQYLSTDIIPLGLIFHDDHVAEAVKECKPFISLYPNCNASKCIKNIAKRLVEKQAEDIETHGLETFWTSFLSFSKNPLKSAGGDTHRKLKEPAHSERGQQERQTEQPTRDSRWTVDTGDVVSSSEQARSKETCDIGHMVQENHRLLSRLWESVSALSKDLGAIKKTLENGNRLHPQPEPLSEHPTSDIKKKPATEGHQPWIDTRRRIERVHEEKRKGVRIEIVFPVRISGFQGETRITDISLGGVFIECENALVSSFQKGQILHLFMNLPTENRPMIEKAEVRYVGDRGLGCKFVGLSQQNEEAIRHCISVFKDTLPIAENTTDPAPGRTSERGGIK
jgi:MinD-like ATPase involved in chromosome partitioning or flagellar assembly